MATTISGIDELKSRVGDHLGYSDWLEVTQGRVNLFADATGDHQWIHVDPERAKAGLQGMARTLAIELGRYNINVNAVAPGFVETRMTEATARRQGLDWEEYKKAAAERIPLRRTGQPRDIATVIAFLCSDDSGYMSGQTLYVAGGPRG